MAWGFPMTIKGKTGKPIEKAVTNVRNYASLFWRSALKMPTRRCLVPFTMFCEWEGEAGAKVERWFDVPSQPITSFAGVWRPSEAGPVMAFLTTEPNPLVAPIHSKAMPDQGRRAVAYRARRRRVGAWRASSIPADAGRLA